MLRMHRHSDQAPIYGPFLTTFSGFVYPRILFKVAAFAGIGALLPVGANSYALAGTAVQQTTSASAKLPDSQVCDGQKPKSKEAKTSSTDNSSTINPLQSSVSDETPGGQDGTGKNVLHLSTKTPSSDDPSSLEGQFCRRQPEEHQAWRPSSTAPTTAKSTHIAQANSATPTNRNPLAAVPPSPEPAPPVAAAPPMRIAQLVSGKLTIKAQGQDFATVIEAVKAATGITVDAPPGGENERVFLNVGPVPLRDGLVALLDGSKYDYIILTSADDPQQAKRLILTLRTGQDGATVASTQPALPVEPAPVAVSAEEEVEQGPPPVPVQPRVIPSSVPTGIDVQKMAAENHMTRGQMLDQLQRQQEQMLDDQAAQAAAAQAQPQQ